MTKPVEPRSPYARYNKRPFRYSDETRGLIALCKDRGTTRNAVGAKLRKEHARKFGYAEPVVAD